MNRNSIYFSVLANIKPCSNVLDSEETKLFLISCQTTHRVIKSPTEQPKTHHAQQLIMLQNSYFLLHYDPFQEGSFIFFIKMKLFVNSTLVTRRIAHILQSLPSKLKFHCTTIFHCQYKNQK